MKSFKDWSISNKLILPLFAVMVLGGGGIIWALIGMHDEIVNDALPERRHGRRRCGTYLRRATSSG